MQAVRKQFEKCKQFESVSSSKDASSSKNARLESGSILGLSTKSGSKVLLEQLDIGGE